MRVYCVVFIVFSLFAGMAVSDEPVSLDTEKAESKVKEKPGPYDAYPEPERNWIASGMWRFVGSELGNVYHRPTCELAKSLEPRLLIGWSTAQEARADGRIPDPVCKPFDPERTPGARSRKKLQQAEQLEQVAAVYAAAGDIPLAADLLSSAQVLRGDALMILADYEKARGRIDNARALYRAATSSYNAARNTLPAGATSGRASGGGADTDFMAVDMPTSALSGGGYQLQAPMYTMSMGFF